MTLRLNETGSDICLVLAHFHSIFKKRFLWTQQGYVLNNVSPRMPLILLRFLFAAVNKGAILSFCCLKFSWNTLLLRYISFSSFKPFYNYE